MATDSRQDSGILSAFETEGGQREPHTASAVADTLDIPEDRVTEQLESLADRGKVDHKQIGESRIWWPVQSFDGRTADGELEPGQGRGEDSTKGCAQIRSHPVFDSEMVGTIVWGEDLKIKEANDAFLEMAGLDYEEALGTSWEELTPEEFYPASKRHISEVEESGSGVPYEKQYYHADGSRWWGRFESRQLNDSEKVELVVEVTERRNREEELEAEQQFVQQSLDALDDVFYVLDTDGALRRWNEQISEALGYTDSDLADANVVEFFPDDEQEAVFESIETILSDGDATIEADLLTAAGERRPYEFKGTRLTDADGATTGIVGIGRDITERVERERELERQNDLFEKSQNLAKVGAWEYNPQEQEGHFTDMVFEIYGVGPDYELAPEKDIQEFYHPDDRDTVRTAIEEAVQSGKEYDIEVRITAADGTEKWIHTRGTPQVEDGTVQYVRGTIQEITERKEREQELQELKTQYQTLVENYPDGAVYLIDTDLECVRAGGEELDNVSLSPDDVIGRNPHALFPEEIAEELCHYYEEALDGNANTFEQEYEGERYRIQTVPVRTNDEIDHLIAVAQNITERKERERELERKTRAIDEAPVGISITDPSQDDNPLIYVNQHFVDVTGYSREDALGENCRFLQGEETRAEHVAEIRQGIDDEEPVSVELRNYRKDGTAFWNYLGIAPVEDESGAVTNYVGFQQDVTKRKERERALEKRERILRELHMATREFYPPESETETAEFLVEFVEKAFGFEYVSVKQFEEDTGTLDPVARSTGIGETGAVGSVSPGSNPVWNAYRHGESQIVDGEQLTDDRGVPVVPVTQALVVPIGDFGVVLAYTTGDNEFDHVDLELIEVVAANADATFQRLRSDRVRNELVDQLAAQQTKVDQLQGIIDTIQTIQRHLADSDSQDALETGVCEELVDTEHIDFVWIGRPQGADADLTPTAWAGEGRGYLDSVDTKREDASLPAQRAATDRETYCMGDVASLVVDEAWAKEALSAELRSVASIPLVYDDVLYGVLTVYSRDEDAFGQMHEHLFTDVASLLVNYSRLLGHRYSDSQGEYTELEFELADGTYPLQRLATDTDSRIRFDTVAENDTAEMRALVTVMDGDGTEVLGAAASINSIVDAAWFGDRDHDQLALTIQKPFLASVVGKHGGTLVESVSDASGTRFRVELAKDTARRPLLDSLSSRYREIEPVAQRQTGSARVPGTEQVADILTERQYEILNAAYHGGYYETPRRVTGADLAESFDISSPAIYNHLQAAHRTLLDTVLQPHSDISDETGGLNR